MNRKIIKLKEGDNIPNRAKLLHTKEEKEFSHYTHRSEEGLFITRDYKIAVYKQVPYFYYEVEVSNE